MPSELVGPVPCWGCIFQYQSHQRGVGCALDFPRTLSKVLSQKSQGSGYLSRNGIYMSVPTEVVADGKAEILSTVNSFKGVTMEPVYVVSLLSFVGADVNDLTFFWL